MAKDFLTKYDTGRIREFFETRKKKVLIFDNDCDGTCSAVLLEKTFPGFDIIPKKGPKISEKFLSMLIRKNAYLYVFLDMAVDHERGRLKELKKALPETKIIIIDHHIPEKNINSRDIVHVNPMLFGNVYQPTSYVIYRLLEKIDRNISKYIWIAVMGCVADYAYKDVRSLLRECERIYPNIKVKKAGKSTINKGFEMIESIILLKNLDGAKEAFHYLLTSEKYSDLIKIQELRDSRGKAAGEFKKVLKQAWIDREYIKDLKLMLFEIKSTEKLSRLASPVSTYYSEKYPDHIIIVRRKSKDGWNVSLRNQSGRVNVGDVANKASKGIGSGGGHKKAAGGRVKDWDSFRNRVVKKLKGIRLKGGSYY